MTAKSSKKKTTKPGNNTLWGFLAIIIVIAILSMVVSYFWVDTEKPDVFLIPQQDKQETVKSGTTPAEEPVSVINGTWVSNYDGAMLTISGRSITLELPGVDESGKIKGNITYEENTVTFIYESGTSSCKGAEGHYLYSIDNNGELFFKLIKDDCESRKERMTASWFTL